MNPLMAVAIAAHLAAHDAKIHKRKKARLARAERNKRRGLEAAITAITKGAA